MSAEERDFNRELAWDISAWTSPVNGAIPLTRAEVESLAAFLTEKGYCRGKGGFGNLLGEFEQFGTRLADEFGPLVDTFRKRT